MMTLEEIRRRGLKALRDELGLAGMVRFMLHLKKGGGNYAVERRAWVDSMSMDEILSGITKARKKKPNRRTKTKHF